MKDKTDKLDFMSKDFLCFRGHHQELKNITHRLGKNICKYDI